MYRDGWNFIGAECFSRNYPSPYQPIIEHFGFVPLSIPGNVEGRPALLVLLVRLRPLVEQDGGDVGVAVERRQVQRSPAAVVRVDVDAVLQQRAYRVGLTVPVK